MTIYADLLDAFKQALRQACRNYESTFTAQGKMVPEHRAREIVMLESLWAAQNDHSLLNTSTLQMCRGFYTGWRGRSELRKNIMMVLGSPTYSNERFLQGLREENQQLRAQMSVAAGRAPAAPVEGNDSELQAQVRTLLQENNQLKQDNGILMRENKQLKETVKNIKLANDKLADQVKDLHVRMTRIEAGDVLRPSSPSASVAAGFRSMASMS